MEGRDLKSIEGDDHRLRALTGVLAEFQKVAPGVPAGMIEAFLLVALHEGSSLRELVELSGKPQSTMSRYLLDMGPRNRMRQPGLGLVEGRIDPMELRKKQYRLTKKGRELLGRVLAGLKVD